jgi:hypothetical protein
MSRRISEMIASWVSESVERHAAGDEVYWDAIPAVTTQGPVVVVVTSMKGAVLDTMVHNQALVQGPAVADAEAVDRLVQALLNGLREERSKQLNGQRLEVPGGPGPGRAGWAVS